MNKTLKEELAFSGLMTVGMVVIMLAYNAILTFGFTTASAMMIVTQFTPIFVIAFIIEQLIVSHNVHKLHKILVSPHDPEFKHIIVMAGLMVTGMCLLMTLYTTLVNVGTENNFWQHYLSAVIRNYPVALVAQLAVVGPLVRLTHMNIFKRTTLVE